jgi:hypothetical protein
MRNFNLADLSCVDILEPLLAHRRDRPVVPLLGLAHRGGAYSDAHVHPDLERPPEDEAQAVTLLIQIRWPFGWRCSCGHRAYTRSAARPRQIRCAQCGDRRSVTSGTALDKKHDLCRWFAAAIALGSARQASARRFALVWGCDYKTAWATLHVLRRCSAAQRDPQEHRGAWVTCHATHGCRPDQPRGGAARSPWRDRHPRFTGYIAVGPNAVYFAERLQWHALRRAVKHVNLPIDTPNDARVIAHHGRLVLAEVHRTVSVRWVQRYLDALAQRATWIRRGDGPSVRLLHAVMKEPRSPWTAIVPS